MKRKSLRIEVKLLDDLIAAGNRCSNICYNYAHDTSQNSGTRRIMKESQENWDEELEKLRNFIN